MIETLRDLRVQSKNTLAEVAKVLGVGAKAVSHYEVGIRQMSLEQVLLLSEFYGLPTEDIIKAQLESVNVRKPN